MHRKRLEMMSALLREDAANPNGAQFDLGLWVGQSDHMGRVSRAIAYDPAELDVSVDSSRPMRERAVDGDKLPKVSCGTTACALGLAALSRRFEKFGLTMMWMGMYGREIQLVPMCNGENGFEAGAELFGISSEDSRYFFDPDCYDHKPTQAEGELFVAQRIDDFLNGIIDRDHHPDTKDYDDDDASDYDEDGNLNAN